MVSTSTETAGDTAMGCSNGVIPTDNVTILVFDGALKCRFYLEDRLHPPKVPGTTGPVLGNHMVMRAVRAYVPGDTASVLVSWPFMTICPHQVAEQACKRFDQTHAFDIDALDHCLLFLSTAERLAAVPSILATDYLHDSLVHLVTITTL